MPSDPALCECTADRLRSALLGKGALCAATRHLVIGGSAIPVGTYISEGARSTDSNLWSRCSFVFFVLRFAIFVSHSTHKKRVSIHSLRYYEALGLLGRLPSILSLVLEVLINQNVSRSIVLLVHWETFLECGQVLCDQICEHVLVLIEQHTRLNILNDLQGLLPNCEFSFNVLNVYDHLGAHLIQSRQYGNYLLSGHPF